MLHSKNLILLSFLFSILTIWYIYFVSVLVSACSVSSMRTATKSVTVELPKDEKENPAMGGGMGYLKAYLDSCAFYSVLF
jgi:hypothetical protein